MSGGERPLRILYIEPFDAGSHAEFGRVLGSHLRGEWTRLTLPGRHWKWRMRAAAPFLAQNHGAELRRAHDVLVASSFLALAELRGLVPELADVPSLLYFHENQLAYPSQAGTEDPRDLHFGFTQLVSALAARRCAFNSAWNRDSFLAGAEDLLRRMPDAVPSGWVEAIARKSDVLPVPLELPEVVRAEESDHRSLGPILLWNHRWEHDKDPDGFFRVLAALAARGVPFRVAVCGEAYSRVPAVFGEARGWLGERVVHWGYARTRAEYWALLGRAHIAVSTARHEFFGAAMLEATHAGALPLVPDRLAYPEHFPPECRYRDEDDLVERLAALCAAWARGEGTLGGDRRGLAGRYGARGVAAEYERVLRGVVASG